LAAWADERGDEQACRPGTQSATPAASYPDIYDPNAPEAGGRSQMKSRHPADRRGARGARRPEIENGGLASFALAD
jgi:hypothetical protein